MDPLVSILIPVHNCHPWVHRAIESAIAQTWPNKEIIVLDDGSTDGSGEVIQKFTANVQIESVHKGGQNAARNHLTRLSRGDWLVYLDADDELAPDSVAEKIRHISSADVVYGSSEVATFRGREKIESYTDMAIDYSDPWLAFFQWKFPNTSAFCLSRAALVKPGGWNENIKNCTDYDLYARLLLHGCRFKAASEAHSLYRRWSETQAVHEEPLRLCMTRLHLMRQAALALRGTQNMTPVREQAFLDASLGTIRMIYRFDRALARKEHRWLTRYSKIYRPARGSFTTSYALAYSALGFSVAEWLAAAIRRTPSEGALWQTQETHSAS